MTDRPKFPSSHSTRRIKLKASCTARNEAPEEHGGTKSKMEKRRIRRRFEMLRLKKDG